MCQIEEDKYLMGCIKSLKNWLADSSSSSSLEEFVLQLALELGEKNIIIRSPWKSE
jgi:hypothetical protein